MRSMTGTVGTAACPRATLRPALRRSFDMLSTLFAGVALVTVAASVLTEQTSDVSTPSNAAAESAPAALAPPGAEWMFAG